MSVLEELNPKRVFYYFEEISKIPRGSYNTDAISKYCVNFAKEHGLEVRKDEWNNVIIKKQASKGRENDKGVILQGHMDMVCEKLADCKHDFKKDPLELMIDGDFVTANGTTLGADDGIAVAMALAILEDNDISIPRLEVIFTTDEEVGMDGAKNIDLSDITGKYVLNLDCDLNDAAFIGCAGGVTCDITFPVKRKEVTGNIYALTVSGLKGGHSGSEIDKERANAHILLGRILLALKEEDKCDFGIVSLEGGTKDNVITKEATAVICVKNKSDEVSLDVVNRLYNVLREEYKYTDEDMCIKMEKYNYETAKCIDDDACDDIIYFISSVPNGVVNYCTFMPGIVETSLNMGVMNTKDDEINLGISVRSLVGSRKRMLLKKVETIAKRANAIFTVDGEYPEWNYKDDSVLQQVIKEEYKRLFDIDMKLLIIHAGLECGYLLEKKPELDIVSFGPLMYDIHTPDERLSISSTKKVYELVLALLRRL